MRSSPTWIFVKVQCNHRKSRTRQVHSSQTGKMIGIEPMQAIIWQNNQFLKTITFIPINGIPSETLQTKIIIDGEEKEEDQTKMTVIDYFLSADWCHGFKPTNCKGRYFLITTHPQLSEACKWLDENLKSLFTEHIPQYQTFKPIKGYEYPKWSDKPWFSHQLGTYADQLRTLYTSSPSSISKDTQWNKPPINKTRRPDNRTLTFDTDEYPELPQQKKPKRNQNGEQKLPETTPAANPFLPTPKPQKHSETKSPLILKMIWQNLLAMK